MKERKISILLPDLRGGGAERVNIDLAYEFLLAGHKVEFVLMQARGEFLEEAKENFSVVDLATPRARALPFTLSRYIRLHRPDSLVAAMWPTTVIAPVSARMSGHDCTVLVSEHGLLSAQYQNWGLRHRAMLRVSTGIAYRLAQHRVGVSSGLVRDVASLSWMRPENFHVIHNPVPSRPAPSKKALAAAEHLWAAPPGGRILTVGTMKTVKNHPLLLRAFGRLNRTDARLMFVGDGTEREALLALSHELNVSNRVIFSGFRQDPTPFYKTADLFVLSSDYEGFGNVIVEAMASGTPVISTNCPSGPAEILDNGRFGRLVPVGDVEALACSMDETLDAPVDYDALKRRAKDFSPEIAARKYLDLLDL